MDFSFKVVAKETKCRARVGVIKTPHGRIRTPVFSPVATKGSVKTLDPVDLKKAKTQVILANTYHLYLQPGVQIIEKFGGFSSFMQWSGPTITDSGGYQVSFLWSPKNLPKGEEKGKVVKITDKGVYFSSHIDGSKHLITPEISMEIQHILGADIIMAFDQPLGRGDSSRKKREAFDRTLKWEERSFIAWQRLEERRKKGSYQALFGIIQGGVDKNLRLRSLNFLLSLGFPGLAIGDESIGKDPQVTAQALDTIADKLPDDKPLHALGLGGGPEGVFEAVERGVDIFDNTSITRMARTGLLFIFPEDGGRKENKFRINIKRSIFREDKKPISKRCQCFTCQNFSKAYIHHLLISREILGLRLASIHNISFINSLMEEIRQAIEIKDFLSLKNYWFKRSFSD